MPATSPAMTATPPTTPPAMAPVGVDFPGTGVGVDVVGVGDKEVVEVVEDEDILLEDELVDEGIFWVTAK